MREMKRWREQKDDEQEQEANKIHGAERERKKEREELFRNSFLSSNRTTIFCFILLWIYLAQNILTFRGEWRFSRYENNEENFGKDEYSLIGNHSACIWGHQSRFMLAWIHSFILLENAFPLWLYRYFFGERILGKYLVTNVIRTILFQMGLCSCISAWKREDSLYTQAGHSRICQRGMARDGFSIICCPK